MNLKEAILKAQDLKREAVEVPEWGVTVYVSMMSAADRSAYTASCWVDGPDGERKYIREHELSRLLVRSLVDENGAPIFTAEDMDALEKKSPVVLDRLWEKAAEINAIGAKAVDDAEKK